MSASIQCICKLKRSVRTKNPRRYTIFVVEPLAKRPDFPGLARHVSIQVYLQHTSEKLTIPCIPSQEACFHCAGYLVRPFSREIVCTYYFSLQDPRRATWVQCFSVVDNSDITPSGLTVHSDSLYDKETVHATHFKQRGSLWPFMSSYSCSCSSSSSHWRCFGVFLGSIFSLPTQEEGPCAP